MSTAAKFCEAIGKCHGRRTRKRFWAFVFLMKEERQKEVARDWCAIGRRMEHFPTKYPFVVTPGLFGK